MYEFLCFTLQFDVSITRYLPNVLIGMSAYDDCRLYRLIEC